MTGRRPARRLSQQGPVVYLHVGEPKSGTTFLQDVLWGNRATLARQGVVLPGLHPQDHYRASQDLCEVAQPHDDPSGSWAGEWELLARQALDADAVAVISHELFAAATAEQAARAITSLDAAEVHVVLTVRDFVSLLPAEWQETVKHRNTGRWQRWVRRLIRTETAERPKGTPWFWRVHDTLGVLRRWSQAVPPDRVHVVTVPPTGSPPDLLWRRFASVLGVDADSADLSTARPNTSLGLAEAELLRRLNVALRKSNSDGVPDWYYAVHVKERIAHDMLASRPAAQRPRLKPRQEQWARGRAEKVVAGLQESGYDIVGALDDLLPASGPPRARSGMVPPQAVLDAAVDVLAARIRADYQGRKSGADAGEATAARVKRWVRNASTRSASVRRLRMFAWRWTERVRARRDS
ncbi:MAG TPA: hypothetical protein VE442_06180 [Jatrophihabitans sp.]|nr:hypothetical protein [Jatrophihabitans sp.]